MSGGSGIQIPGTNIGALSFGFSPFVAPYTVFMPISWAYGNSNGVTTPNGAYPTMSDNSDYGTGVTNALMAASQASLQSIISGGLASVQTQQNTNLGVIASLFGTWGADLNSIGQQSVQDLTTAINKSAKACSNFFGCLF